MENLPEILTAEQIAKYLGLSRRVVYDLLKTPLAIGGIPSFNIGYSVRAEKADLIKWINEQKNKKENSFSA